MHHLRIAAAALIAGSLLGAGATFAMQRSFSDVQGSEWFAQALDNLAAQDIVKGYEDGSFRPNQTISRSEVVVMLSRLDAVLKSYVFNTTLHLQEEMELLSYAEARAIALYGPCGEEGTIRSMTEKKRNEENIWVIPMTPKDPMCGANCRINAETGDSEIHWMCTGVLPSPTPTKTAQ